MNDPRSRSSTKDYSAPSFAEGALVALLLSALGTVACISLALVFVPAVVSVSVCVMLAGGYMVYLIKRSEPKSGKLLGSLIMLTIMGACVLVPLSFVSVVVILMLSLWLLRSSYYRQGVLDSLFDLGRNLVSIGAAVAAVIVSESYFLAFWTFFLTQALHVYLPSFHQPSVPSSNASEQFRKAFENAESALNRMYKSSP
jgi:hypothetical protein